MSSGGVPLEINHQGVVSVGGVRFTGTGLFWFAIVDPDSGENAWTNDGTNIGTPNRPNSAVALSVADGIYNVRLGDTTIPKMTAISDTVFADDNLRLRIWFNDDSGGGTHLLSPDHVLTSSPYAFMAARASFAPGLVPIGSIVAWHKSLGGVPALPQDWIECTNPSGTVLIDVPGSPLNGQLVPDLNSSVPNMDGGRFLRGSAISGLYQNDELRSHSHPKRPEALGGYMFYNENSVNPPGFNFNPSGNLRFAVLSTTGDYGGTETRPVNMSVVWIMRVK